MLKPMVLGSCLAVVLVGCAITPHANENKVVNTALTAACLATENSPCRIQPSAADKAKSIESKAAAVRANAQLDSTAADQYAAQRSSCLTETGPRLPVSSSQCASYKAAP